MITLSGQVGRKERLAGKPRAPSASPSSATRSLSPLCRTVAPRRDPRERGTTEGDERRRAYYIAGNLRYTTRRGVQTCRARRSCPPALGSILRQSGLARTALPTPEPGTSGENASEDPGSRATDRTFHLPDVDLRQGTGGGTRRSERHEDRGRGPSQRTP